MAAITMQSTRQQILDHLHLEHRGTVKELARRLCLTPTGVRQHLSILEREGLGDGRPMSTGSRRRVRRCIHGGTTYWSTC
jgi:predicted ArsR family transcriptional regulator